MCEHRVTRWWVERDGWVWTCQACGAEGRWPDATEAESEGEGVRHG